MVFTVSSSEHTQKIILSSKLKTGGTSDNPKFQLKTPIQSPWNQVSMVCLESVVIQAPSVIRKGLLDDTKNRLSVYNGGIGPYDYYSNAAPAGGYNNSKSMKDVLWRCVDMDMTNTLNVARFLIDMVNSLFYLQILLPSLPGETDVTVISRTAAGLQPTYMVNGGVVAGGGLAAIDPAILSARLALQETISFVLCFNDVNAPPNTSNYSLRLSGPWLKIFNLSPNLVDGYYTLDRFNPTLQVQFRNHGFDMLHMHANFARAVQAASGIKENYAIGPTNILWSIQILSDPGRKTYFTNFNTAGKVVYYMPTLEEIELYFSDEWGDRLDDGVEFQVVLTFDFTQKDPLPEPMNIKRARRSLALP